MYRAAWSLYYTPAHMRTLLHRAAATGVPLGSLTRLLVRFALTDRLENVHPLQGGILRIRRRSERRPGLPREMPWVFWPRLARDALRTHAAIARLVVRLLWWKRAIGRNAAAHAYSDLALTPVVDDEDSSLDLLTRTAGARAAVAHTRRVAALTKAGAAAGAAGA